MCLSLGISLIIASIEFIIVIYLYKKIKDKKLYPLLFFVLFLGLYQSSEFILCKSNNQIFWAKIGFSIYTFLPIFLYHLFTNSINLKFRKILYIIPIFFTIISFIYKDFITNVSCNTFHITTELSVLKQNLYLMSFYRSFYFSLPFYSIYLFLKKVQSKSSKEIKILSILIPFAILLSILYHLLLTYFQSGINLIIFIIIIFLLILIGVSLFFIKINNIFYKISYFILFSTAIITFISFFVIEGLTSNFSSIFCQFALIYGISSIYLIKFLHGKTV